MKIGEKIVLFMLVFVFLCPSFGFTQQVKEKPTKEDRIDAVIDFVNDLEGNPKVRLKESGTPASIMGIKISKYGGTQKQIAESFLRDQRVMLGIENVTRDLKLIRANTSSRGSKSFVYQQHFNNVPIIGSGYAVRVNKDGDIYYVNGKYFTDVDVNTKPSITPEQVSSIILNDIGGTSDAKISEPTLLIHVINRDKETQSFSLVYHAFELNNSLFYRIDAHNGDIIQKGSSVHSVTGKVYETNKTQGDIDSSATLIGLNPPVGGVYKLEGRFVNVNKWDSTNVEETDGTFVYSTDDSDAEFDQVMVYHHIDRFVRYMNRDAGLDTSASALPNIYAHTSYPDIDSPGYDLTNNHIRFGYDSSELRNPTREGATIAHEYVHYIIMNRFGVLDVNNDDIKSEEKAMNEAVADYFALAYKSDILGSDNSLILEYADIPGDTKDWTRDINNNFHYNSISSIDETAPHYFTNFYDQSLIFSGALWDLRDALGIYDHEANEMILDGIKMLGDDTTFLDGRESILAEATGDFAQWEDEIIDAFDTHGINPPLTNVYISGPGRAEWPDYYTYQAHVSGGVPPYTYTWDDGGGTASTATYYIDEDVTIGVTIRDTLFTGAYASKAVEYTGQKIAADSQLPTSYGLEQNYPNPFNPTTEIKYQLPEAAHVRLTIYNILGQEVVRLVDTQQALGFYSVKFDASRFASGTYIYRLEAGDFIETKRMVLIK